MLRCHTLVLVYWLVRTYGQEFVAWRRVVASNSSLATSTVEKITTTSEMACSLHTGRRPWSNLFCFHDNICEVSDLQTVPYESPTPIPDPVQCRTKLDGCFKDGLLHPVGTTFSEIASCGGVIYLQCKDGIFQRQKYKTSNVCPYPFTKYGPGECYLGFDSTGMWCGSRQNCINKGGDLITFEKATSREEIKDIVFKVFGGVLNSIHVGLVGNASYYEWVSGEPLPLNSPLWGSGEPTIVSGENRATWSKVSLAISDLSSTSIAAFRYICQIKGNF